MLTFGFNSVSLHNVVVVVGTFKSGLHFGELVLDTVQLYTGVFTGLSHFTDFFLLLTELKINALVFISQLLSQGVLETDHENLQT